MKIGQGFREKIRRLSVNLVIFILRFNTNSPDKDWDSRTLDRLQTALKGYKKNNNAKRLATRIERMFNMDKRLLSIYPHIQELHKAAKRQCFIFKMAEDMDVNDLITMLQHKAKVMKDEDLQHHVNMMETCV